MKQTYSEKLRNPKWQKKRLLILQRDDFSCRFCASNVHTLNVHHIEYIKGNDPWDYPDENFLTLCEDCHQEYHLIKSTIENLGHKLLKIFSVSFNLIAIYSDNNLGTMALVYNRKCESFSFFIVNDFYEIIKQIEEIKI